MSIQKKEVEYCKEADDVMVLMVNLMKGLKAKKPIAQLGAEELQDLMNAMNGMDGIPEEAKSKKIMMETVGYRLGDLVDSFIE